MLIFTSLDKNFSQFNSVRTLNPEPGIDQFRFNFRIKHSWPSRPPRRMKMMRRSRDERLRKAANCLSRLRGLRPDPMSMHLGRHCLQAAPKLIIWRRDRSGLRARWRRVSAVFQNRSSGRRCPPFFVLHSIFVLNNGLNVPLLPPGARPWEPGGLRRPFGLDPSGQNPPQDLTSCRR
jgi:hypothetical protein